MQTEMRSENGPDKARPYVNTLQRLSPIRQQETAANWPPAAAAAPAALLS